MKFKNYSGMKKGRLTAIRRIGQDKHGHSIWLFRCDCGMEKELTANSVFSSSSTTFSCGCSNRKNLLSGNNRRTHGKCHTRLYRIWKNMISRASDERGQNSKWYSDVSVCPEWRDDFQMFYDWAMANGYMDSLSIDRIDPSGDYEPSNCRWSTDTQQARNKRNNHIVIIDGVPMSLAEALAKSPISKSTYYQRIRSGMTDIEALTTPLRKKVR